jgi:O-acetyl-ADP-ribose deacetylase (regulator of RNase III)
MRIGVENVKKATQAALEEAENMGFEVIAMPGMGTGVGGVSKKDAAEAMLETILKFKAKKLKKVILIDIDDEMVTEFKKALELKKSEEKKA